MYREDVAKYSHERYVKELKSMQRKDPGPYYFNIIRKNTYSTVVTHCEDILELSDNFLTFESLEGTNLGPYGPDNRQRIYAEEEIKAVLSDWADKIQEKSACTSYMNGRIREVIATCDYQALRRCTPSGYEVSGDRIYHRAKLDDQKRNCQRKKNEIEETRAARIRDQPYKRKKECVTYDDVHYLSSACEEAIQKKYNLVLTIYISTHKNMEGVKRLISWVDVNRALRKILPKKQQQQDVPWIKKVWVDPSLSLKPERNYG